MLDKEIECKLKARNSSHCLSVCFDPWGANSAS